MSTLQLSRRGLRLIFGIGLVVFGFFIVWSSWPHADWSIQDGKLQYDVDTPHFQVLYSTRSENLITQNITFRNDDTEISALLFLPTNARGGIVLVPGAGVTKEGERYLADYLVGLGYAVIVYDPRSQGESRAMIPSWEEDLARLESGQEPMRFAMIEDALLAAQLLKAHGVDVIMAGESAGGRTAIVAAAIDPSLLGAIGISTSGYSSVPTHLAPLMGPLNPNTYLLDYYRVVFIHSDDDDLIPLEDAQVTAAIGNHKLTVVTHCGHGYCESMNDALFTSLEELS